MTSNISVKEFELRLWFIDSVLALTAFSKSDVTYTFMGYTRSIDDNEANELKKNL